MRRSIATSWLLAAASLAVSRHTIDSSPPGRRKTLGFGPEHPHAVFYSSPYQIQTNGFTPLPPNTDPFVVAERFVNDKLLTKNRNSVNYRIRKDSYTDSATGVTHVYARQIVNGIDVADGDMNVNVKDGVVLSYGNSFYEGDAPSTAEDDDDDATDPHTEFCSVLTNSLRFTSDAQISLSSDPQHHLSHLSHLHSSNCQLLHLTLPGASDISDMRPGLLKFMALATPETYLTSSILDDFKAHMDFMTVEAPSSFAPDSLPRTFLIENVPGTVNPVKAHLAYIQVPNKSRDATVLKLVWKYEIEMHDNWYEAAVSAHPPHRVISVVDWASDSPIPSEPLPATYNVYPWGTNDPTEGNRSLMKENFDSLASPAGWHALPYAHDPMFSDLRNKKKEFWRNTTTTWGNNVFAQENWDGFNAYEDNYRPDAGSSKDFDFKYSPKLTEKHDALLEAKKYINFTVTQLFYTSNLVHDLYYRYGFDEVSGNFQQYNFGRGGAENDAVIANAQDGSGYNNANFMTPPDGQNGRMRMYLWNTAMPYRDGDLEAGIVIHELSHGLSTRLTGGPANSGCLGWGESGGMGEGWGDFLATTIRSTSTYSDYPMGAWAANTSRGIRHYIYSTNETVNPSTYKTLDQPAYWGVHAVGEVWAQMLWVVEQKLVERWGFVDDLFPPKPQEDGSIPAEDFYRPPRDGEKLPLVPKHGNSLIVQLVINAMKLQPCRPSFFDARDAILQADQILTGGENFCTLWEGFASRGLGVDANVEGRTPWGGGIRANGYTVPTICK